MVGDAVIMSKTAIEEIVADGIGEFTKEEFNAAVEETTCHNLDCFSYLNQLATNIDRRRD